MRALGHVCISSKKTSVLYQRLLDYIRPDVVHVLIDGRIVRTGGPELATEIEQRGFDWLKPAP